MTSFPSSLLTHEDLQDLGLSPSSVGRAVRRTELLRIRHGVHAPLSWWRSLDDEARLRRMHHAMALRAATPPVFGHASAALLHGLHLSRAPAAPSAPAAARVRRTHEGRR